MHGDGLGMSVGVVDQELYYFPTNGLAAGGAAANGSPASGGGADPTYGARCERWWLKAASSLLVRA